MSLKPQSISAVRKETFRVAHAIYPKGNIYMRMRDELEHFSVMKILRICSLIRGSLRSLRGDWHW